MTSPYVRRLRLGMELQALRDERNWTQARAARMIGKSRQEISKMERGLTANPTDVLNLLEALGVEDERWTELTAIARDAAQPGWWDSLKDIGERQALYANLESGAEPNITLRVLPAEAQFRDFVVPRGTFSLYTYPDPRDPRVVAIDTVTSDVILSGEAEVATYERIWDHSREAALPPEESAKFLTEAADALPDNLTSVVPGGVDGPEDTLPR
jgi:transcriptional regulator with XRE-family HTH domain